MLRPPSNVVHVVFVDYASPFARSFSYPPKLTGPIKRFLSLTDFLLPLRSAGVSRCTALITNRP